jgi:hypothetical protein
MIEQQSNAITARVHYTNSGANATGLTVTVSVYNPAGTKIVDAASASEIGLGVYEYELASGSVTSDGLYTYIFDTAGTVDQRNIAGQWAIGVAGIENLNATISSRSTLTAANVWDYLSASASTASSIGKQIVDNIDAAISTRLPTASYTSPPSAASIATAVWTAGTRTLTSFGTLVADIWATATSGLTTAGSIGKHIVDYLTGDIYARLGAPTGASISADIAGISGDIDANEATIAAAVVNGLRGDIAIVRSPVEEQNVITVRVGDDYLTEHTRSFVWQLENFDTLVGGTASLAIAGVRVATGAVTDGGTDSDGNTIQTITVEATDTETLLLAGSEGQRKQFTVQITVDGDLMTTISGYATVLARHPQS